MSFSSNGVLAKARALYGKRLTAANFEDLLKKKNVSDIVAYLRADPTYGYAFRDVKEELHRAQLEALLIEDGFTRSVSLMRYAARKELPFYSLRVKKIEGDLIVRKAMLLNSRRRLSKLPIPARLHKFASFDLDAFMAADDYDALCRVLKGTDYLPVLNQCAPDEEGRIDLNRLELMLKTQHYQETIKMVKKYFRGRKRKELLLVFQTEAELENMTKIYRAKKYFHLSSEQIKDLLILDESRIPDENMRVFIEAEDASDFLKKLSESSYRVFVDQKDYIYIEYYADAFSYHLAQRYMRFSNDPAMIYCVYNILHMLEINNLKHIIEGIRYGEDPQEIRKMLIY